ncbi:MAG: glutathione S-transferase family protein [Rhodospirillales bacterium]
MPTLYNFQRSGNCYKIRLMASLLGIEHDTVSFDPPSGDHKKPDFLAINPLGQVPAWVEDDGTAVCDSQAILVFLAKKYDPDGTWFPDDALTAAEVVRWLSFTAHEILTGLAFSRAIKLFGRPGDFGQHQEIGRKALAVLDAQLADRPFLAGGSPTIADIAAYPYVCVAGDADLDPAGFRNVSAWIARIEELSGYTPFNPNG